jgi:hypothetical protein
MPQPGLSAPSSPVMEALQPLRRLIHRTVRPYRLTAQGKIYLGEGQPVMVLPVFGHGEESTVALRRVLDEAGFTTYDWGLGPDTGPGALGLDRLLPRLEEQVINVFEAQWKPVTLLGWSLSGIYAREVAKRTDPLVRQVITLGTPFNTAAHARGEITLLRKLAGEDPRAALAIRKRLRQRPPVPCTSIYSAEDAKLPSCMCTETETLISENIQVPAGNAMALASHPKVLEVITHRLAQPDGEWRAFTS